MTVLQDLWAAVSSDAVPAVVLFFVGLIGMVMPIAALLAYRDLRKRHARLPAWTRMEHIEAEAERRALDHDAALERLADLKVQVEDFELRRSERDAALADLDATREKLTQVQEQIAALEPQRAELAAVESAIRSRQAEVTATDSKLRQLTERGAQLQGEVAAAQRQLEQLQATAAGVATTVEQRREELEGLQRLGREAATSLAEVQGAVERVRADLHASEERLRAAKVDEAASEARFLALKAEVAALEGLKGTLERWLERAQEQDGTLESEVFADLFQMPKVLTTKLATPARGPTEEEALQGLQAHLRAIGLRFGDRRLHAFHTSLKTSLLSPITVLAGISGTGKSELPRRYAEGMGIHFLQMAVQPRWDSPQDLFGFYNYLEKRFVATEFARALVHLDVYNHGARVGENAGRMLLVLLDEMNLARVEYYFSEFLSRLEVRRSVNPMDASSRQQAEIVLEAGGAGIPPVRVFAGANILFVGTMNEDESTQTLSDKVNDRANVLRFGRPNQLGHTAPNPAGSPAGTALSQARWESWQRDPDQLGAEQRERLHGWIQALNDQLGRIGRPFGHRVNQAIQSYVANYPLVSNPQGLEMAFADQLEQRILPKLRGIDTEDTNAAALGAIRSVVQQQLQDERLADSIQEGMETPLFQWSGVDRED